MFMSCRLHLDTKGWDWVPREKLNLFTCAWSIWSSSLVTSSRLCDWLAVEVREEGSKLLMELQQPVVVARPGRGRGKEGWAALGRKSHFSPPTANSVLTAHISVESRGLFGQGVHNAGYFHPDVLCHHRSAHSVLHFLSALWARSSGMEAAGEQLRAGRMKLTGPAPCLWTHQWIFASGHYFGYWLKNKTTRDPVFLCFSQMHWCSISQTTLKRMRKANFFLRELI